MQFDAIAAADLAIDRPDFKASAWKRTVLNGEPAEYSTCYELVGGRWEAFVSVRKVARRHSPRRLKPRLPIARRQPAGSGPAPLPVAHAR